MRPILKPRTPIGCWHQPRHRTAGERRLGAILGALLMTLLMTMCGTPAEAAPTVGLHTLTWHDKDRPEGGRYEWVTPGAYLRLGDAHGGPTVGVLRNSLARWGAYAGWTWSTDERAPLSAAFTAAGITGYPMAPVVPLLAPSLRLRVGDRAALRLITIPQWHPKQGASVASLALEWELQ